MSAMPKVVQEAWDFEEHGAQFYQQQAKAAENPLLKRLFLALAVEEGQHQLRIQEIYQAIQSGGTWPDTPSESNLEAGIKKYFANLSDEERKLGDNVEGLEVAMGLERKGYAMYQEAANRTDVPMESQFYRAMQKEEGKHLEALENVYYYLTDTGDWFSQEESKVWNWMST